MRLIGYIRVSTEEQEDGRSLSIQDQTIHKYCELFGHELIDVVVDGGISAGTPLEKRPGGSELMDRLREGQAEGFVFSDLDRAFRVTVDGLMTAQWFEKNALAIHCVNEKIDTADPDGWFILTIKLAAAERERNKIRFRARKTSAGLREQGLAWGPTPYGCVREGERLFRDPATWAVRETIMDLWEGGDGLSMNAIATELRERGIEAPGGGRIWHRSTLRGLIQTHHDLKHIPLPDSAPEARVSTAEAAS